MELVSAGYTVDESVTAVKNTGAVDAATALDYLQSQDEGEDNLVLSTDQKQLSRQDSQFSDDAKIDWYAVCVLVLGTAMLTVYY